MRGRVLIVDDHPVNLKLACELLESEGYLVDRAISAEAALTAIADHVPDLILMDLALPGMDGLELTRLLQSQEGTRAIPVVALTAFAMKRDQEKAMEAGCVAYVPKPIDTRSLPAMLAAILASRRPGAGLPVPDPLAKKP
jgi:CheY-like chemotaxis protein